MCRIAYMTCLENIHVLRKGYQISYKDALTTHQDVVARAAHALYERDA
jgi:hypothetical protein